MVDYLIYFGVLGIWFAMAWHAIHIFATSREARRVWTVFLVLTSLTVGYVLLFR